MGTTWAADGSDSVPEVVVADMIHSSETSLPADLVAPRMIHQLWPADLLLHLLFLDPEASEAPPSDPFLPVLCFLLVQTAQRATQFVMTRQKRIRCLDLLLQR